jgi:signal transduction histidine kinase
VCGVRTTFRRWLRSAAGLTTGAGSALVAAAFLIPAAPALAAVPARVHAAARRLAGWERARVAWFFSGARPTGTGAADHPDVGPAPVPEDGRAALRYLAARIPLGLLGGLTVLAVIAGALYASMLLWGWFVIPDLLTTVLPSGVGGLFLLFLAGHGVFAVADLERQVLARYLGPSREEALRRRIEELATTRADVVAAVDDERRRIERDLHDGVQQRLVALGMLLGRARRRPDPDLLAQAHEQARQAMTELREVAWRVHPTVLDEAGLPAALEAVAERSPLPVTLDCALPGDPPRPVATAAYFVVSESVTNAVKHSGASRVAVRLTGRAGRVTVAVTDDGRGGADPAGGGLLGLARRVAALDGRLRVDSPPGGPTTVTAELPCA